MGMGPYLPFSWVKWKMWLLERRYRGLGLESKLVQIHDGATTIHVWAPRKISDQEKGAKLSPTAQKPALLLVQGFGMDGTIGWEKQIHAFAKAFRVYVPDLLFFGKSTTTRPERSEHFQAECMKKMLDALEVDQVYVLGTSYGGMVGYRMAATYPELVKKLVVASSGIMMTHETNGRLMNLCKITDVKTILVPKTLEYMRLGMSTATVWRIWMIPSFVIQDMFEWFFQDNRKNREELIDNMITGSVGAPPVPLIWQEVLIVWGTKDKIFDPELAEQLKQHLGERADLVYMKGCGHVPQIEQPRAFNSHVLQFLLRPTKTSI